MQWIMDNVSTIIVSLLLIGIVIVIIKNLRKNDGGCVGSCGGCASSEICHDHKKSFVDEYHESQNHK
ncbi:MAG: FeoB-associated Cys-rich membrane protein [Coprobacillaceae bacterium]